MNGSKKINVNYSSLVGLKAELLRKQTEVKNAKVNAEATPTQPKPKVRTKKSETKKLKIDKEPVDVDDIKAHRKSKLMLEAKARLYENLKKSHSNRNEHFLVDFANKSESEEESVHSEDYDDINSDPEDDWVEYEDCFGRTRKCLRRDLDKMREKDDFVKHEVMKKPQAEIEEENVRIEDNPKFIPKEPEIEIMRRKWEEQTEKLTEKTNIHYQDVLFDEARAHGVGYYEFSQDEEVRAKQQANLENLRKETLQKQKEMQRLKEMKDKMEQNRLKAARIRQRIRAGLPPEPIEKEELGGSSESAKEIAETEPEVEAKVEPNEKKKTERKEETSLVEIENKIKAFGKLLGKRAQWREMSQEEWVHKRRKDRVDEFAPAYRNFKSAGYLKGKSRERANNEDKTLFDDNLSDKKPSNTPDTKINSGLATNEESKTKIPDTPSNGTESPESDNVRGVWREVKISTNDNERAKKNKICYFKIHASTPQPEIAQEKIGELDSESSDSSDSDVIGPMPLYTQQPVHEANLQHSFSALSELSNIDFAKPPPILRIETASENSFPSLEEIIPTPVLPPNPENPPAKYRASDSGLLETEMIPNSNKQTTAESSSNTSDGQAMQHFLNEDKIAAGLKYLRANFERQKPS